MAEDEMVRWHHQLNRHEFEQALGVGNGQGDLVCCSPQGHKELDTNERLNCIDSPPLKVITCSYSEENDVCYLAFTCCPLKIS